MGKLHSSQASLGFYGDELDPLEITTRLGGVPTICVAKGETWLTALGVQKVAKMGSWRRVADKRCPGDLDSQIAPLFSGLTDDLAEWNAIAQRFRGRIFCGLFLESFNDGLTLRPETLRMIGERGLVLDLDIYERESN
ncbi:MAG: DUF4279 domain-containing protein [Pseudomonadota bacterium]